MECETQLNSLNVQQAINLRRQVKELLNRLVADREQSERRMAESGKRDPMKFVTGRTAFDAAIATAHDLIGQLDYLLARLEANQDLTPVHVVPQVHTVSYPHKNGSRNGKAAAVNGQRPVLSATITP